MNETEGKKTTIHRYLSPSVNITKLIFYIADSPGE
jgi:hypothetical protein